MNTRFKIPARNLKKKFISLNVILLDFLQERNDTTWVIEGQNRKPFSDTKHIVIILRNVDKVVKNLSSLLSLHKKNDLVELRNYVL